MGETPKKQDVAPSSTDDGKDEKALKMKDATTKDAGAKPEIELSEEDLQLKTNLEVLVQRAMDSKAGVAKLALENRANRDQNGDEVTRSISIVLISLFPSFVLKSYLYIMTDVFDPIFLSPLCLSHDTLSSNTVR